MKLDQLILVSNDNRATQAPFEERVLQASQENQHRLIDIRSSIVAMQQNSSFPAEANPQTMHNPPQTIWINRSLQLEQCNQEVQLALSLQTPRGSRPACNNWCSCACHYRRSFSVLSTLSVGYSGIAFFTAIRKRVFGVPEQPCALYSISPHGLFLEQS